MNGPKVFISYTTRDAAGRDTSKALFDKLEAGGFLPLRDKERLQKGDAWHAGLDDMLAMCHGAVVLFSPEAVDSEWVQREAEILSFRKRVCPGFTLLPALIGGATAADLQGRGLEDLGAFQSYDESEPGVLDAIASDLDDLKSVFGAVTPEMLMERKIGELLAQAPLASLKAIVSNLGIDEQPWMGEANLKFLFARHIAAALVAEGMNPVRAAEALAEIGSGIDEGQLLEILRLVVPGWVPAEAGRRLRCAVKDKQSAAIASPLTFVSQMYTRRAACSVAGWGHASATNVNGGEDADKELVREIRKDLATELETEEELLDLYLKTVENPQIAFVPGVVRDSVLQKVATALPRMTLVMGDDDVDEELAGNYKDMVYLPEADDTELSDNAKNLSKLAESVLKSKIRKASADN